MDTFLYKITDAEFQKMRDFIYEKVGINLTDKKKSLVIGRLQKILKSLDMNSFHDYYDYVKADKSGKALSDLITNISTNHTFFNREKAHFEFFVNTVLPETVAKLQNQQMSDIRVWSAGCSSGQEPYMLVMLMMEYFDRKYSYWDAGVLATDISDRALTKAIQGNYTDEDVSLLPQHLKYRYFTKLQNGFWQVRDMVKKEVLFRKFNLMNEIFPFKKKFHVIFCRNVMIYFDEKTKKELVNKYYNSLEKGGYLFIGHSETLGRSSAFKYVQPAIYKKD